jgi:hypothetical protein
LRSTRHTEFKTVEQSEELGEDTAGGVAVFETAHR